MIGRTSPSVWLLVLSTRQFLLLGVEQILLPNSPQESVIVMDNAAFHKGKDRQKIIEGGSHRLLYLPPYSPDLNPLEKKME